MDTMMNKAFTILSLGFTVAAANAAVLVDWNLGTVNYPEHPNAAVNNSAFNGVASSVATVPALINVSDLVTASSSGHNGLVWSSGNAGPGKLNLQRWDHPNNNAGSFGNGNGTPNNWLQFTLTADAGYFFTVTSADVSAWRNGAGAPANWAIQYHNGTSWVDFGTPHSEANAGDSIFRDVSFNDSVTGTALDFRFVAYGPTGGTGNLHINNLLLDGTVDLIPEPSTALLGGFGLLALLRRRR